MKRFCTVGVGVLALTLVLTGHLGAQKKAADKSVKKSAKPTEQNAEVVWLTYEEGLKQAAKENKHVMVDFYTTWCGWCKKLDKDTYANPKVQTILRKHYVAVKVNAESNRSFENEGKTMTEAQLASGKYGVTGYPTIWFLKPNGEAITPLPGYVGPDQFVHIINYIKDDLYEKMEFDDYLKQQEGKSKS